MDSDEWGRGEGEEEEEEEEEKEIIFETKEKTDGGAFFFKRKKNQRRTDHPEGVGGWVESSEDRLFDVRHRSSDAVLERHQQRVDVLETFKLGLVDALDDAPGHRQSTNGPSEIHQRSIDGGKPIGLFFFSFDIFHKKMSLRVVGRQLDGLVGEFGREVGQVSVGIEARDVGRSHLFSLQLKPKKKRKITKTKEKRKEK